MGAYLGGIHEVAEELPASGGLEEGDALGLADLHRGARRGVRREARRGARRRMRRRREEEEEEEEED
eukprot:1410526-Rhodomonas_salina.2